MAKHYKIILTKNEIEKLNEITHKGYCSARIVLYARALLLLDKSENNTENWKVQQVATAVGLTTRTLEHLKERFIKYGLDVALERKKQIRPSKPVVFDGKFEAKLTQLACSQAPEGHARWTIRLLAHKLVELEIVPSVSKSTVCSTLKKRTAASSEQILENSNQTK